MAEMDIAMSNRVIARDDFGRFISDVHQATHEAVRDLLHEGMEISRDLAPVGHKADRRTVPLKDSMFVHMESRTRGYWGSFARHALPIEKGARRHFIFGNPNLGFFWEREGREWIPAEVFYKSPGMRDFVDHPGNRAQPFLRPAYDILQSRIMSTLRTKFRRVG